MISDSPYLTHPFLDGLVISHRKALTIDGLPYEYPSQQNNPVVHHHHHTIDKDPVSVSPAAAFLSAFSSPQSRSSLPDAEGAIVGGYTLGPVVGHGGFSTIRRAFSNSGGTVAVKIVLRADLAKQGNPTLARKRLDYESAIWASLSHEHVLPLFSAVHTPYADYFFTLLCPSGSLYDIIKSNGHPTLPLEDLGVVFSQVVRGLRYLHEVAGVVHRDIKLENVLVDEMGVCRIADFGMARKIGELDSEDHVCPQGSSSSSSSAPPRNAGPRHRNSAPLSSSNHSRTPSHVFQPGSLPYASPELLLPPTSSPLAPHPAQDIWALGVLLYVMLTGHLPFYDSFDPRLQMKILHGVYDMPPEIGRTTARVLQGCLERSVPSRWTIDMVDEMAWDIGSCVDDDDDATEAHNDFPVLPPTKPRSPSRSRHEPITPTAAEPSGIPSLETARRRSSSRVKRSLSRAPMSRSISSGRRSSSRGRNVVSIPPPIRVPNTAPPVTALNTSILGGATAFSDSPSQHTMLQLETVLGYPPALIDRGRRIEQNVVSRSPSPSVLPATPEDTNQVLPVEEENNLSAQRYLLERGRSSSRREHSGRTSPLYDTAAVEADAGKGVATTHKDAGELDVLRETTRWAQNAGQPILSCVAPMPVFLSSRRAGSTPPAPTSSSSSKPTARRRTTNAVSPTSAKPIPIPINGSRSKSLEEWQRF